MTTKSSGVVELINYLQLITHSIWHETKVRVYKATKIFLQVIINLKLLVNGGAVRNRVKKETSMGKKT